MNFSVPIKVPFYVKNGSLISVTATNNSNGDYSTSELGPCFTTDTIFKDSAEAF